MRLALVSALAAVAAFAVPGLAAAAPDKRRAPRVPVRVVGEAVELRTATSKTMRLSDGTLQADLSSAPVNYRDGQGRWQPIDNKLQANADGSVKNAANAFDIRIPAEGGQAITVRHDGQALSFRLLGAKGRAKVKDDTATFKDALAGVTASYQAQGAGLKETLTLASPASPREFEFAVDAAGLRPKLKPSGELGFDDSRGKQRFAFAAPWMKDAAGRTSTAVRYELRPEGGRTVVRLIADAKWLGDAARKWPVRVDPTVYAGFNTLCQLTSGSAANTTNCTGSGMPFSVGRDPEGRVHRAAATFDLEPLPKDALITNAEVKLWFAGQTVAAPSTLELLPLSRSFTSQATWSRYSDTASWASPGGDLSSARQSRMRLQPDWVDGWASIGAGGLVQGWLDGSIADHGAIIKTDDESAQQLNMLDRLHLFVEYRPRTGVSDQSSHERQTLGDGSELAVNLANGNAAISATDIKLPASGGQLTETRVWNSLDVDAASWGTMGRNWNESRTVVTLARNWTDGSYVFRGPGGIDAHFHKRPDGSFVDVSGLSAKLEENPHDDGLTLTFSKTGERWEFDDYTPHYLQRIVFPNGYVSDPQFDVEGVKSLSDNQGHRVDFFYDAQNDMRTARDQAGGERHYDYDPDHYLIRYRDTANRETRYTYDHWHRITAIQTPDGKTTRIAFDDTDRATSITLDDGNAATTDPTTRFRYESGSTVVTRPDGTTETYVTPSDAGKSIAQANPVAVAPSQSHQADGQQVDPSVQREPDAYRATGTLAESTVAKDAQDGVKIATKAGPLTLKPQDVRGQATDGQIINGDAVAFANTQRDADTVVRPTPKGVETFSDIRSADAPEAYRWKVDLEGDEQLRKTDDGGVQIVDPTPATSTEAPGPKPADRTATQEDLSNETDSGGAPAGTQLRNAAAADEARAAVADAGLASSAPDATSPATSESGDPPAAQTEAPPSGAVDPGTAGATSDMPGGLDQTAQNADRAAQEKAQAELDQSTRETAQRDDARQQEDVAARIDPATDPVVVAEVKSPTSVDATGKAVPTTLSVDGDTITMRVEHKGTTVAYPVAADPWIQVTKYRLAWKSRPIYRHETYVKGWNERWVVAGHWWNSEIWRHPNHHWGGGWWTYTGGPWGLTVLVWTQPSGWSPRWLLVKEPVYATRTVLDRYEPYLDWEPYTVLEWEDDWVVQQGEPEAFESQLDQDGDAGVYAFRGPEVGVSRCMITRESSAYPRVTEVALTNVPREEAVAVSGSTLVVCPKRTPLRSLTMKVCVDYQHSDGSYRADPGDCKTVKSTQPTRYTWRAAAARAILCRPGEKSYQIYYRAKLDLIRNIDVDTGGLRSGRRTYGCNEDGAWRVLSRVVRDEADGDAIYGRPRDILRATLLAKEPPPGDRPGFDAHHIYPASERDADPALAQEYAYTCGIQPNDRTNGIFLRGFTLREGTAAYEALTDEGKRRQYHPDIHTNVHFRWLSGQLRRLAGATTNGQCDKTKASLTLAAIKFIESQGGAPRADGGDVPADD